MNRNGNSAIFFLYVCIGKKIKELFAYALNEITIGVRSMSSMMVVSNAEFARLFAVYANKKTMRIEEARQRCRVLLVKTH